MAIAMVLWSGDVVISMTEIPAGEFKSRCLALMDRVNETGEPILITKRGKPIAKLVPASSSPDDVFGYMTGKVKIVGDVVGPVTPLDDWDTK
jgi:prevent-host-death family protein